MPRCAELPNQPRPHARHQLRAQPERRVRLALRRRSGCHLWLCLRRSSSWIAAHGANWRRLHGRCNSLARNARDHRGPAGQSLGDRSSWVRHFSRGLWPVAPNTDGLPGKVNLPFQMDKGGFYVISRVDSRSRYSAMPFPTGVEIPRSTPIRGRSPDNNAASGARRVSSASGGADG